MEEHIIDIFEYIHPKVECSVCKSKDVTISYDHDGYVKIICCKRCGHKTMDTDCLRCTF